MDLEYQNKTELFWRETWFLLEGLLFQTTVLGSRMFPLIWPLLWLYLRYRRSMSHWVSGREACYLQSTQAWPRDQVLSHDLTYNFHDDIITVLPILCSARTWECPTLSTPTSLDCVQAFSFCGLSASPALCSGSGMHSPFWNAPNACINFSLSLSSSILLWGPQTNTQLRKIFQWEA